MGNAHSGRGGRGNRRGRRGPPRQGPSQAQNGAQPRHNPSASGARPSAEIVLPAARTNGANGHSHDRQPKKPEQAPPPKPEPTPDATPAPFVLSQPTGERASPYRFVGERRMLPRDASRARAAQTPGEAETQPQLPSVSAPREQSEDPFRAAQPTSEPEPQPRQVFPSREDAAPAEDDDGDDGWTPRPRGDVRGDVGPLIDALHEVFVQDRAISSQGGSTRCGICYLHFSYTELEYRDAEGYYVCPSCKRALGTARLPMVRKQRRG